MQMTKCLLYTCCHLEAKCDKALMLSHALNKMICQRSEWEGGLKGGGQKIRKVSSTQSEREWEECFLLGHTLSVPTAEKRHGGIPCPKWRESTRSWYTHIHACVIFLLICHMHINISPTLSQGTRVLCHINKWMIDGCYHHMVHTIYRYHACICVCVCVCFFWVGEDGLWQVFPVSDKLIEPPFFRKRRGLSPNPSSVSPDTKIKLLI